MIDATDNDDNAAGGARFPANPVNRRANLAAVAGSGFPDKLKEVAATGNIWTSIRS